MLTSPGLRRGVLVVLLVVLGPLLVSPSPAGAAASAAPTAGPARPISGERVTFRGSVPPQAARGVRLQRKQGGSWVQVATGRTGPQGRYALTARVLTLRGSATVSYRVVAPRARVAGAVRPRVVSATRTLRPLGQTAGVRIDPSESDAPALVTVTATFTPARAGRAVRFQQRVAGSWQTVATGRQDAAGVAEHLAEYRTPGAYAVRVVTATANGAPAATSPSRTVTVRPAA